MTLLSVIAIYTILVNINTEYTAIGHLILLGFYLSIFVLLYNEQNLLSPINHSFPINQVEYLKKYIKHQLTRMMIAFLLTFIVILLLGYFAQFSLVSIIVVTLGYFITLMAATYIDIYSKYRERKNIITYFHLFLGSVLICIYQYLWIQICLQVLDR